jgi:predicted ATPase
MVVPGYEVIQEIVRNGWYALYRGRRNADRRSVLLKTPLHQSRVSAGMEMLEREFEILSGLQIAGVPQVYELISDDGNRYLALEDRHGSPLSTISGGRSLSLESFFKLAIQLSTILSELHRREIVHQNISPEGILFNSETGDVQLMDFSFATRSEGEVQGSYPPYNLRYTSPEQTGRMNRAIDYRTDFYSLGVTFYELLAGNPPFPSTDPLELIHLHIAKTPPSLIEIDPDIPEALSAIVMKLLAKTAEQRYQSALGLKADLEVCAKEWVKHNAVPPFPLGLQDVSDRFNIPQALYGRERKVEQLREAFERVCDGATALLLVTGYSGIGKTSLIQELYKPILRERGYFISGKFDQIACGIPFGALTQAFRGLVQQLLTESEERLGMWRARLSDLLGANGGVLAEVIPEIELIIGEQPTPMALGPTEALNRFQLVFQNFVRALAQQGRPLVVFLDDLQWVDSATLSLLQPLLTSADIRHLFLIGAYRDNEVDAAHPLMRALGALESAGVEMRVVSLEPLNSDDLTRFVCDALHGELADAAPLARLVLEKTGGNPFFVIQFLKMLRQEGFLKFDYAERRWRYRIEDIAGASMTDNVIDLMTRKIRRLSPTSQRALTLASCIGGLFDRNTLAVVSEKSAEEATADLQEAINEGLIIPITDSLIAESLIADCGMRIADCVFPSSIRNPHSAFRNQRFRNPQSAIRNQIFRDPQSYSFIHDRIQQAAYALIPDERKQVVHLSVGRLLRAGAGPEQIEEKIFDIVHHLNLGGQLITEEAERLELARLNLSAGRKAKSSTAYEAALGYFKAGIRLLSDEHWESEYDLAFALHLEAAECCNLCGNFDEAESEFVMLLQRATSALDKARVFGLRIVQCETRSRYADALYAGREALALFGVSFPESEREKEVALENELVSIQSLLGNREIASLIDLPVMIDPNIRMVMNLLTTAWASSYISGDQLLTRLFSAVMVRLSLTHGNSEESAYGYATHTVTVGPARGDYEAAYEFGCLALRVNERFKDTRRRAKICQQFHAHASLWRRPLQEGIPYSREALRSGIENGDFTYAIYGAFSETWAAIIITPDLAQYVRDYSPLMNLIKKLKVAAVGDGMKIMLNWARALRGETRAPTSLSDEDFDEDEYRQTYRGNPFYTIVYAAARQHLCYLFGANREALEAARTMREIVHHLEGTIWTVVCDFWNGLTLAVNYAGAGEEEQKVSLAEMEKARKSLAILAENCPENFLCQSLLLSAEIERVKGRTFVALELFEQALRYAEETEMIQYQALSNELCGRLWLDRGKEAIAAAFLSNARDCYAQWGAAAKVEDLKRKYPFLLERRADRAGASEIGSLDLFSVLKAAQAIAGEIELEKLLAKLIRIAIENAGAERGDLILRRGRDLFVQAEGSLDSAEVRVKGGIPIADSQDLPISVINYVSRTGEGIVLGETTGDDRFGNDPDIRRRQPRSIMCIPVLTHGEIIGVFYLENNKASGAFTPDRIEVMQILASQAAVSLENARLYDESRLAETTLRSITEGTAAVTGGDFFASLVRHISEALPVKLAFATECANVEKTRARMIAFWDGKGLVENFEYDVKDTTCEKVYEGETCFYPREIQKLFPKEGALAELNGQSYIGLPLCSKTGELIGHLAVIDDKHLDEARGAHILGVLKIFAERASVELERTKAEAELRQAMAEIERLKNQLHAENVYLQEEIRREHNFDEIVGGSPALLDVLQQVERIAPTDATVLILGETGTGKELIARAIHDRSKRRDRPLVKVNCGAISAGLVESELFGHVKGAFTGAVDKRTGRFDLADGGTLFLDEVGELPLETQVKLLRVLQEGEFEPVGSSKTVKVDVRIIAATNRSLEDEVKAGRFRADLFYRLNVLPLHNPPLRDRKSDIPQLAMFFLSRFSRRFGKQMEGISQETMETLMNYNWPGNIRELHNLIERGVVLASGPVLTIDRNFLSNSQTSQTDVRPSAAAPVVAPPAAPPPASSTSLEDLQRQHILTVLAQTNWVIEGEKGAARMLDLHPNTLRSRLKKMGIERPKK